MQFNIVRAFAVYAAAQNLILLYRQAVSDQQLTHPEIQQLLTVGVVPILQALGEEVPANMLLDVAKSTQGTKS